MTYEERQLLRLFTTIQQKCHNPNDAAYPRYGGRGISMCPEWRQNSKQFLADIGPRPSPRYTLQLKNMDGDFSPGNVRWVDVDTLKAGHKGQRGALTDENVVEILRLVNDEGMSLSSVALGFPATTTHIRNIALGHTRKIEGYPYPARLYEKRTLEQIEKEEAIVEGLWSLTKSAKATMKELFAWARVLRYRTPPK